MYKNFFGWVKTNICGFVSFNTKKKNMSRSRIPKKIKSEAYTEQEIAAISTLLKEITEDLKRWQTELQAKTKLV
jgi:hypothetical protein